MANLLSSDAPIGVFDSGLGGLAVLREIKRVLPREDVLYLGDTARRPYGPQPVEDVQNYAVEITGYLLSQGAKAVVIACNTASVAGADAARRCFPHAPIFDMVSPGVRAAIEATENGRIGVWGTALTVNNRAYDDAILELEPGAEILGVACPDLLRLAEKGEIGDRALLLQLAERYFSPIAEFDADVLVLGCTDLTCVRDIAEEVVGAGVEVVDPAQEVVREVGMELRARSILREAGGSGSERYLITGDDKAAFSAFTCEFLSVDHVDVEHVPLQDVRRGRLQSTGCGG